MTRGDTNQGGEYLPVPQAGIHENASRGEDGSVTTQLKYDHSSAGLYILGEKAGIPVTTYLELQDIDLTTSLVSESLKKEALREIKKA